MITGGIGLITYEKFSILNETFFENISGYQASIFQQ